MKFSFNRAMVVIVISSASLLAVTSCSKSNNNNSSGAGITATVGGSAWTNSFPVQGVYSTVGSAFLVAGVQIKSGDSTGFEVGFGSPVTLNKALTSDGIIVDVAYIVEKSQTFYDGSPVGGGNGHSIVTVTSYDSTGHKVSGTFSGVLYNQLNPNDSVVVTSGNFSSTYLVQ
jgi:hypothetical protein